MGGRLRFGASFSSVLSPNPRLALTLSQALLPQTAQSDKIRLAMDATHKVQDFNNRMNDYKQTYDGHY